MADIDDLLNELKEEYETGRTPSPSPPSPKIKSQSSDSINQLLDDIKEEIAQPPKLDVEVKPVKTESPKPDDLSQNLHIVIRAEDEQKKEQRRRESLKQKAHQWLAKLDPTSDEGMWFEEFSYSYDSKLEAAITYLEALREAGK